MTEDFLQYVWQFQQFDKSNLLSKENHNLSILKVGQKNFDAGPDFSNARIMFDGVEWAGQVEIHCNSSEWINHKHQSDLSYDNVILHVVWNHNEVIRRVNGSIVPTLELKNIVFEDTLNNYRNLVLNKKDIPCDTFFKEFSEISKLSMLDKALANRLERKANEINAILIKNKQDWEETSYQILARNFGFKLNSEVFLRLAEVLPLKIIKKHQGNLFQIEALCFGQAGFLNDSVDDYSKKLEAEYNYLANKYGLQSLSISKHQWKYLRTRPSNFPSIRLHQFASIINNSRSFFLDFVLNAQKENIIKLLQILPSKYWQTHYDFDKKSKVLLKGLGTSSIENVIINTTVSLLAAYSFSTGLPEYFERAIEILGKLKPEKNTITEKWENLGLKIKSSFDSQAVIEQYNEFCTKKRCMECSLGSSILKSISNRNY
jgi:hypothetical protein